MSNDVDRTLADTETMNQDLFDPRDREHWQTFKAEAIRANKECETLRADLNRAEEYNRKLIEQLRVYRDRAVKAEYKAERLEKEATNRARDDNTAQMLLTRLMQGVRSVTLTLRDEKDDD